MSLFSHSSPPSTSSSSSSSPSVTSPTQQPQQQLQQEQQQPTPSLITPSPSTPSSSSSSSAASYPSPPSKQQQQQTTQQQHFSSSHASSIPFSQENLNKNHNPLKVSTFQPSKYPPSLRHASPHVASVLSSPLNLSFLGKNAVFYQPQIFAAFCYNCKSGLLTKLKSGVVLRASPEARLVEDLCENCQANWSQLTNSDAYAKMPTSIYAVNRHQPAAASLPSAKPQHLQPNLLHDVFFSAAPKIESFDMDDVSTPLSTVDLYSSSAPPSSPACFSSSATAANSPSMAISPSPSCSSASSASYGNSENARKPLDTVGLGMDGVSFGNDELSSTASVASEPSPPKTQISPPLSPNDYLFDDSETLFGLDFSDACRVDAFAEDANTTSHDPYLAAVAAAGELFGSRPSKSLSESGFLLSEPYGWPENTYRTEEPMSYLQDGQTANSFSPPPPPPNGPPPMIASCGPYAPSNPHGALEKHRGMSAPHLFVMYGSDAANHAGDRQAPSMPSPYSSSFPSSVISSNPTTVSLDAISPRIDTGCFGVPTSWNDGSFVDHANKAKRKTNANGKDEQEMAARTSRVQRQGERRRTLDYQTPRPFSRRMTDVSDTLITFRKPSSFSSNAASLPPVQSGRRGSHVRKRRCSGLKMPASLNYSEEGESEDGGGSDSADEMYVAHRHHVGISDSDAGEEYRVGTRSDASDVEESEPEVAESRDQSAESSEEEDMSADEDGNVADAGKVDEFARRRDSRTAVQAPVKRTTSSGATSTRNSTASSAVTVGARRKSRIAQESEPPAALSTNKQSLINKSSSPVDDREPSPAPSTRTALVAAREAGGGELNSPRETARPTVFESLTASQIDWCRYCGTTEGVNWRPGPWGKRTLCNKHGCDYKGYGFACKLPRLDLTAYAREKIDERVRPVLQLFCTTCHDPDSYVSNTLVRCEGCPRAYHRLCYDGPCALPSETTTSADLRPWFCSHSCSDNARRRRIVVELPRRKLPLMSTPKLSSSSSSSDTATATASPTGLARHRR